MMEFKGGKLQGGGTPNVSVMSPNTCQGCRRSKQLTAGDDGL
jgi:hypothetical protein